MQCDNWVIPEAILDILDKWRETENLFWFRLVSILFESFFQTWLAW